MCLVSAGVRKDHLMRVHLRDIRTGKYLGKGKIWTEKQTEAHDFRSGDEAIKVWSLSREDSVEMIYAFGGEKRDLSIPLGMEKSPSPQGSPQQTSSGWT